MRWLAASFFFIVAVGCLFVALTPLIWPSSDTARGVEIGVSILFVLLACCSVFGGLWVLRNWSSRHPS